MRVVDVTVSRGVNVGKLGSSGGLYWNVLEATGPLGWYSEWVDLLIKSLIGTAGGRSEGTGAM